MNLITGILISPIISVKILFARSFIIFCSNYMSVPFLSTFFNASYYITAKTLVEERILVFISWILVFLINLLGSELMTHFISEKYDPWDCVLKRL